MEVEQSLLQKAEQVRTHWRPVDDDEVYLAVSYLHRKIRGRQIAAVMGIDNSAVGSWCLSTIAHAIREKAFRLEKVS